MNATWRDYAERLTPAERAEFERIDASPYHPLGAEGHRRGQIAVARMYIAGRRLARPMMGGGR